VQRKAKQCGLEQGEGGREVLVRETVGKAGPGPGVEAASVRVDNVDRNAKLGCGNMLPGGDFAGFWRCGRKA